MVINRAGGGEGASFIWGDSRKKNVSACATVPSMVLTSPRMLSETEQPLSLTVF